MEIKIKKIELSDLDEDFINKLRKTHPAEDENPDWNLEKAKSLVSNPKNIFILGFADDIPAGFLYGHELDRFDNEKEFFIYEVGVAEEYQRRGIARGMIEYLKEILKKDNFNLAWVPCFAANTPAVELYKSTGAKIAKEDGEYVYEFEYKLK